MQLSHNQQQPPQQQQQQQPSHLYQQQSQLRDYQQQQQQQQQQQRQQCQQHPQQQSVEHTLLQQQQQVTLSEPQARCPSQLNSKPQQQQPSQQLVQPQPPPLLQLQPVPVGSASIGSTPLLADPQAKPASSGRQFAPAPAAAVSVPTAASIAAAAEAAAAEAYQGQCPFDRCPVATPVFVFKVVCFPGAEGAVTARGGVAAVLLEAGVNLSLAIDTNQEADPTPTETAQPITLRLPPSAHPPDPVSLSSIVKRATPEEVASRFARMPPSLAAALMPFQADGVRFGLERRGRVLIADEMGVGKTVQAMALASCYMEEWPLLVIVPASLRRLP
ncbi:MAG: hypothetical protein WDW38_005685 [Sanguina aurantia]